MLVNTRLMKTYDFPVEVTHDTDPDSGLMELTLVSDLPEGECVLIEVSVHGVCDEPLRFYRTGAKHWVNLKNLDDRSRPGQPLPAEARGSFLDRVVRWLFG